MEQDIDFYKQRVFELTNKVNQLNSEKSCSFVEYHRLKTIEKYFKYLRFFFIFQYVIFYYFAHIGWFS